MKAAFTLLLGFAVVILAESTLALAQPETEPVVVALHFRFKALNKKYQLKVTSQEVENSTWDHEAEENPPLSAGKAIKLADEARKSVVKDRDDIKWKRGSLGLTSAGDGKWVWLVGYQPYSGKYPEGDSSIAIVILMDGTVLKPKFVANYDDE
jgi:hypothetical protein